MAFSLRYVEYPASPDREFACEFCPLSFDRHHDLKRHIETHSGEKPYICDRACGKAFTRKDALKRHQTTFPFCPPVRGPPHPTSQSTMSSSHMQPPPSYGGPQSPAQYIPGYPQGPAYGHIPSSSHESRPYPSRTGWVAPYGSSSSSAAHYANVDPSASKYSPPSSPQYPGSGSASSFLPPPLYGGDYPASPTRPYACDMCPLSFDRHHDLKRHKFTHAGERPYVCNGGCEKTFTRKDALKRHQLSKECGN